MGKTIRSVFASILACIAIGSAAGASPQYSITLLDPRPGTAWGTSSSGVAVGYVEVSNAARPAIFAGGTTTLLPVVGSGEGLAINTYGDVVGWSNPNGSSAAFQFIGGAMDYPFGANVGQSSRATGINDARTVVGYAYDPNSGYDRAFILQGDSPTILGTFGGRTSYAYAINNDGAVVGIAQDATLYEQPFLYQNGAMTALPIPVGHVAGGALGISSNGVIAGFSLDPVYGQQPIIWNGPTFTSISLAGLPFGGGGAWAVNSSGTVIGYGTGVDAAWVWKDGQAHRLSDITDPGPYSGLQIQAVYGINDSGQMVGFARLGTSQGLIGGAVLLSPIPELSSAAMFAVGLSLLVLCRRRAMCRTDLCDR